MTRPRPGTAAATLETLPSGFQWFAHQMIDLEKVAALRRFLRAGGEVPPVVAARYGDKVMPVDGHHRMMAHDLEGLPLAAWVVSGRTFDRLDRTQWERAENCIYCDGVPALQVADAWAAARGAT